MKLTKEEIDKIKDIPMVIFELFMEMEKDRLFIKYYMKDKETTENARV